MFQKSPAQTAFWTFIWTNPKVARKVANRQCQNSLIMKCRYYDFSSEYFRRKTEFQTKYFRSNTDFSKVLFSAAQGLFILFHRSESRGFYTSEYFHFAIGISVESYIRCADLILQQCKVSRLRKYRINRNIG